MLLSETERATIVASSSRSERNGGEFDGRPLFPAVGAFDVRIGRMWREGSCSLSFEPVSVEVASGGNSGGWERQKAGRIWAGTGRSSEGRSEAARLAAGVSVW